MAAKKVTEIKEKEIKETEIKETEACSTVGCEEVVYSPSIDENQIDLFKYYIQKANPFISASVTVVEGFYQIVLVGKYSKDLEEYAMPTDNIQDAESMFSEFISMYKEALLQK